MSVARNYQVSTPVEAKINVGANNLTRIHPISKTVANPVSTFAINGLDAITANTPTPNTEVEVFVQGSFNRSTKFRQDYQFDGTFSLPAIYAVEFFAETLGITWGSEGQYALPISRVEDRPVANIEVVQRAKDGKTVQQTLVYQDIILKAFNAGSAKDNNMLSLPFYSKFDPFVLNKGAELVTEVFQGDGSATDFALNATPVKLVTKTANGELIDWVLDNFVYIKKWGANDIQGTRLIDGVTESTGVVSLETALEANEYLEVCYAKAVV